MNVTVINNREGPKNRNKTQSTNFCENILHYFIYYIRIFYIELMTLTCLKCDHTFFYVYLGFNHICCPACSQEYCKYCLEIKINANDLQPALNFQAGDRNNINNQRHDNKKCLFRYFLIYSLALLGFIIIYLKFVFVCNSNVITKYLTVTFFILEYIVFNDKIDNLINTFLSFKNIIMGSLLLVLYDEKDILIYLVVGIIQLIMILLINTLKDYLSSGLKILKSIKNWV
jgi:hypothetical protein